MFIFILFLKPPLQSETEHKMPEDQDLSKIQRSITPPE